MSRSPEQVAEDLKAGGTRLMMCLDGTKGGLILYKCIADPRVIVRIETPKRGPAKKTFVFGDDAVEVEVGASGPIVTDEGRTFDTFDALCEGIAAHDAALADERDWLAAAPQGAAS